MPRHPADSWLADLCAHFGLKAYEAAMYLGMDAGQFSQVAAGRRPLSQRTAETLAPLAASATSAARAAPPWLRLSVLRWRPASTTASTTPADAADS